jgi:hypothetical protein
MKATKKWTVLAIQNDKDLTEDLSGRDQRESESIYDETAGSNHHTAYGSLSNEEQHN